MAEVSSLSTSIACVCLNVASKVDANKARHVAFPLNREFGVTLLPDDTLGSFPGGGVPQRMKANPKNSSTAEMISLLHSSPWCKYSTTRAAQVALSTIVLHLTPEQNQALDVFDGRDEVLAGSAPVIVNERGLLRGPADGHDLECYMLRRTISGAIHCVYVSEGKLRTSPLSQQVSLLEAVSASGAILRRGDLMCLFNNSCMPRGACSLLFSVLATIPVWSDEQQTMLVKRREFFLQQYATPVRIITNDLVAARNVNMRSSARRVDKLGGLPDYKPKQELPPGSILANILSRRPGLQPPECVSVPPTSTASCLQAFTACIVEAARLTLGLRTVDGQVTAKHVHARLQQVQQQLCKDDSALALSGAHAVAAAGLPSLDSTMIPPPRVVTSARWSTFIPKYATSGSAVAPRANSGASSAPVNFTPTFESLTSSALSSQTVPRSGPPGGEYKAFPLRAASAASGSAPTRSHLKVRLRKAGAAWTAERMADISGSSASSSLPEPDESSPVPPGPKQLDECKQFAGGQPQPLQVATPRPNGVGGIKRARGDSLGLMDPGHLFPVQAQAAGAAIQRAPLSSAQPPATKKHTPLSPWPTPGVSTPGGTFSAYPHSFAQSAGYAQALTGIRSLPGPPGNVCRSARDFIRTSGSAQYAKEVDPE